MTLLVGYPTNRRAKAVLSMAAMLARSSGQEVVVCTVIRDPRVPGVTRDDPEFCSYVDELADTAIEQARRDMPADVPVSTLASTPGPFRPGWCRLLNNATPA